MREREVVVVYVCGRHPRHNEPSLPDKSPGKK